MPTTLTSTGVTFPDATTQTSAVNSLSDLSVTATAAEVNKLDGVTATTTELNYVDGVTSAIQTQLNGKQASGSYAVTSNNLSDLGSASTARTNLGLGSLATLSAVGASQITDNTVGAAELNVSGNGTSGQILTSDGDGSFSWTTSSAFDGHFVDLKSEAGEVSINLQENYDVPGTSQTSAITNTYRGGSTGQFKVKFSVSNTSSGHPIGNVNYDFKINGSTVFSGTKGSLPTVTSGFITVNATDTFTFTGYNNSYSNNNQWIRSSVIYYTRDGEIDRPLFGGFTYG